MGLQEALALSFKVIADWRVIFIAVSVLLLCAALRYVGSVYHNRPPRPRVVPRAPKAASARARAGGAKAAEPRSGEGLVE